MEGITSALLIDADHGATQLVNKRMLPEMIAKSSATVVAIMGAGDIAFEVPAVMQILKNQQDA
jgi:LDH2 family malate/lactate/ureidoglycolate dehydrogenase